MKKLLTSMFLAILSIGFTFNVSFASWSIYWNPAFEYENYPLDAIQLFIDTPTQTFQNPGISNFDQLGWSTTNYGNTISVASGPVLSTDMAFQINFVNDNPGTFYVHWLETLNNQVTDHNYFILKFNNKSYQGYTQVTNKDDWKYNPVPEPSSLLLLVSGLLGLALFGRKKYSKKA